MNIELIRDILIPIVGVIFGSIGTLLTLRITAKNTHRQIESVAEQSLRKDLIDLYSKQQTRIDSLDTDMLGLREKNIQLQEKNAELYELYIKERETVALLSFENTRLKERMDALIEDKAQLADQIIIMENKIRELQKFMVDSNE